MTEPTGHTIDGAPWEEPRSPHLPDRLTSMTPWVLPFVLVAAYQVWLMWDGQPTEGNLAGRLGYWVDALRFQFMAIAPVLFGVALFIRHPDARSRLPQVATGAFALLLQQVMRLLEPTLSPVFVALTPESNELSFYSPAAEAYGLLTTVVGVFGIAWLARGLSAARRFEDAVRVTPIAILLVAGAVGSSALSLMALIGVEVFGPPVLIAGTVLVNLLATLAWAYLFVVALSGWLAREEPRVAWALAAVGAGLALTLRLVAPVMEFVPAPQDLLIRAIDLLALGALIGFVLLVVAFAMGLPSTESVADAPDPMPDPPAVTPRGSAAG